MTTGVAIATSSSSRARDREVREASRRMEITMRSALGKTIHGCRGSTKNPRTFIGEDLTDCASQRCAIKTVEILDADPRTIVKSVELLTNLCVSQRFGHSRLQIHVLNNDFHLRHGSTIQMLCATQLHF
jgi:hypothetical protein